VRIARALSAHASSTPWSSEPRRNRLTAWLNAALVDPNSVQIRWRGEPRPGELTVGKDKQVSGFLVDFSTNSRNVFGAYTGWQKHTALIRDGKVVTATGFVPKIF